jgi:hypothetical protein
MLTSCTEVQTIKLYDSSNIDELLDGASLKDERAKVFFSCLIKEGVQHYIDNVHSQMMLLAVNEEFLPITINNNEYNNSFVSSPYSQYVSYAYSVLEKGNNKFGKNLFKEMLKGYGAMMQGGQIDKVVIVNNWLFTTNPPPTIDENTLEKILNYLIVRFPEHAIIFRSITPEISPEFYTSLKRQRFNLIASRYVYITNAQDEEIFKTRIFKSDLKLLKGSPYSIIDSDEILDDELSQLVDLYQALYIKKYSHLNPQFNVNFLRLARQQGILRFKALKSNGQIEGVIGYFYKNGIMLSPFFGYDPIKSEKNGIYRILCTLLMLEAQKLGAIFNQSAGGSFYKKIRRAKGHLEYSAVYHRHLPFLRRLPWNILKGITNTLGARIMKKY